MRRIPMRWMLAAMSVLTPVAHGADGWGDGFSLQIDVTPGSDACTTLRIQNDGKLLLGGTCSTSDSTFCAVRLRPNGSYDSAFGAAGLGYQSFEDFPGFPSYGSLAAMALAPDGRSVFAGNSLSSGLIATLDRDGVLVPGGWHLFLDFHFSAVAIQADGRIVAAGPAVRPNSANYDFGVTRLMPDLSLDMSFGNGGHRLVAFDLEGASGGGSDSAAAIAIQPDGKIVVAGAANIGTTSYAALARLDVDGQLDQGFGDGGRVLPGWGSHGNSTVNAIAVDRDGSLLMAGRVVLGAAGADSDFVLGRLSSDGSPDPSFGILCPGPSCLPSPVYVDFSAAFGVPTSDSASAIAVQSDGKIVLAGSARLLNDASSRFAAARLTRYGELDASFGIGGRSGGAFGPGSSAYGSAVAIGNGGIMIAGSSNDAPGTTYRFGLARLQLDLIFTDGFQR